MVFTCQGTATSKVTSTLLRLRLARGNFKNFARSASDSETRTRGLMGHGVSLSALNLPVPGSPASESDSGSLRVRMSSRTRLPRVSDDSPSRSEGEVIK